VRATYQHLVVEPDGARIGFADRGDGDAVLLVHAGVFGAWFAPLAGVPALTGLRVIEMRRAGYLAGPPPGTHLGIGDHARHCAALLDHLGVGAATVCGHSSSCLMVLQLALDRPELVRGLVLVEPAAPPFLHGREEARFARDHVEPAMAAARAGDTAQALDMFMGAVGGARYRSIVEAALGAGGHEQRLRDAAFFFSDELPAVREWALAPADARRIRQRALLVEGGDSLPRFHDACEVLAALLPDVRTATVTGATHMLPLQDPDAVGRLIADLAAGRAE
jgi:pimeloyl-ACP methyl ester carboxylesterase